MLTESNFAEADEEDRADELTGAVKIVTSLATIDGAVLMDLALRVIGFGVKIKSGAKIGACFDGPDFSIRGTKAKRIDIREFGTRHASMLRYCQVDKKAIGIVISQDGHARLITTSKGNLTLWDNVKLLSYEDDYNQYARAEQSWKRKHPKTKSPQTLGYSQAPKTVKELLRFKKRKQ